MSQAKYDDEWSVFAIFVNDSQLYSTAHNIK